MSQLKGRQRVRAGTGAMGLKATFDGDLRCRVASITRLVTESEISRSIGIGRSVRPRW